MTTSFLNEIGYIGFAGVEFAEEVETGEIFFLKLNARAVLPNWLTADAGIDLTTIGYLEMSGADITQGCKEVLLMISEISQCVRKRSRRSYIKSG